MQPQYLSSTHAQQWDEFVHNHPNGTFFHLSGWQEVIEKSFGHKTWFTFVSDDSGIMGVLPLVEVKSALFGHSLVSTPFCVYGGALAVNDETRLALEDHALSLGHELGVDYVELRYEQQTDNPNYEAFCHHSTFKTSIADSPDAILASIKKKQRAVIRHALKNELDYTIDQDVELAHRVYSESVRNLGTPVFSKGYFNQLAQTFSGQLDVLTVSKDGNPHSSVLSFYYKDTVLPYYGGGLFSARGLKSNDLMYYQLMCHAQDKGCDVFDFGRSKDDSGAYKYKATWGIEAKPLYYLRALVKADSHPNLSPNNPKYAMFIKLWQKLPLFVSNMLGPYLSKYLG